LKHSREYTISAFLLFHIKIAEAEGLEPPIPHEFGVRLISNQCPHPAGLPPGSCGE